VRSQAGAWERGNESQPVASARDRPSLTLVVLLQLHDAPPSLFSYNCTTLRRRCFLIIARRSAVVVFPFVTTVDSYAAPFVPAHRVPQRGANRHTLGMRFVILHHEMPAGADRPSHFDLMLESEHGLKTWSLSDWPPTSEQSVRGIPLPIHRKAYLTFEGPISGRRGSVRRIDEGDYDTLEESDCCLVVLLNGRSFDGEVTIRQTAIGESLVSCK